MKYVTTGLQVLLGFPDRLTQDRHRCSITMVRLHPSGNLIAALVRRHCQSNAHYLIVWALAGYDEYEGEANPSLTLALTLPSTLGYSDFLMIGFAIVIPAVVVSAYTCCCCFLTSLCSNLTRWLLLYLCRH